MKDKKSMLKLYKKITMEEIKEIFKNKRLKELINEIIEDEEYFCSRDNYCLESSEKNIKFNEYINNRMFAQELKNTAYIQPENAIKFNLVNKKNNMLGNIFGYEIPYLQNIENGGIDLVSYKEDKIKFIELKKCKVHNSSDSNEQLIRAVLEIVTYYHYIYKLNEEQFNEKIYFNKQDIQLCLLLPKSMYSRCKKSNKKLFDEIMSLDNFRFYFIELKKVYEEGITNKKIGTNDKLFLINEYSK